jgi:hypothetical protein
MYPIIIILNANSTAHWRTCNGQPPSLRGLASPSERSRKKKKILDAINTLYLKSSKCGALY